MNKLKKIVKNFFNKKENNKYIWKTGQDNSLRRLCQGSDNGVIIEFTFN